MKTPAQALDLIFDSDAGDSLTFREYFRVLLSTLWNEGEGFSGKRPFGNSGWEHDLYVPLIKHGFISGSLDEDGFVDEYNRDEANNFVQEMILAAFQPN